MKKILEYRKQLGVEKEVDLKGLKSAYRSVMKEWHPDKFANDEAGRVEAEEKSKIFIEAYEYLVSIHSETLEGYKEEFMHTITNSGLLDYQYKARILEVKYTDGSVYEYLEVPNNVYNKLLNSDSPARFVRRMISGVYSYRKVKNPELV
jgi:hypothetical protein